MLIGLLAAAAATLGGALVARRLRRTPAPEPPALPPAPTPAPPAPPPYDLPLKVGDVVQYQMATRWPQAGLLARDHERAQLVILLSEEAGEEHATVAFAKPEQSILWLTNSALEFPGQAPSCIEVDGSLLQRSALLALTLETLDNAPSQLAGDARIAIYDGPLGGAALLLDHPY